MKEFRAKADWGANSLIDGTDVTVGDPDDGAGGCFGVPGNPDSLDSAATKIAAEFEKYRQALISLFPKELGFEVSDNIEVSVNVNNNARNMKISSPIYLTYNAFPEFKAEVFTFSGDDFESDLSIKLAQPDFISIDGLQYAITTYFTKNSLARIYSAWNKVPIPEYNEVIEPTISVSSDLLDEEASFESSNSKSGMTYSFAFGLDKSFLKEKSKYGLYLGMELFAEFNPKKSNIDRTSNQNSALINKILYEDKEQVSVRSNAFGITPLIGLATNSKWTFYTMFPIQYATYSIKTNSSYKQNVFKITKNKIGYGAGVGVKFNLNDRFSVGIRYVCNFKSSIGFKNDKHIDISDIDKIEKTKIKNKLATTAHKVSLNFSVTL